MKSAPIGTICIRKLPMIFKLFLSSLLLPYLLSGNARVGDKVQVLLNILTSVWCQFKACAIVWRKAVDDEFG